MSIERLSSSWLLRCLDVALVVLAVTGAVIVRATIDLAHVLGLTVVAQGVEDAATRSLLVGLGIDRIQGYAIARPLTSRDLETFIDARGPAAAAV